MGVILPILFIIGLVLVGFVVLGVIISGFYRKSTREVALVRTGLGGQLVVIDGGCLVLPVFNEVMKINMRTLRLEVSRDTNEALITADRMRVDVSVEFYVAVAPTREGVATAAQTLGDRTFDVAGLREMVEGKLVDGLRAVAATMTMDELHEQRERFVDEVKGAVAGDLTRNGLALESVSLTALDQTPFEALDENNAFNALGMQKLAEVVAESKKRRAAITADAEVEVERRLLEEKKAKEDIRLEAENKRIETDREIMMKEAEVRAEVALKEEEAKRQEQQAQIDRERAIKVADQEREVVIAEKSEEESKAQASADLARAEAAKAEEEIKNARQIAEAERQKRIEIIEAERKAQVEATEIRVLAQAEKEAAQDRADAHLTEARASADAIKIEAEASLERDVKAAEGQEKLIASENSLAAEIIEMRLQEQRLKMLPAILEAQMAPVEKIGRININRFDGMSGAAGSAGGSAEGQGAPTGGVTGATGTNDLIGMLMQYKLMSPLIDQTLRDSGLDSDNALVADLVSGEPKGVGSPAAD